MPISVTCQCGSRLEIDEKFLGKEIPCPDCQRPLPTNAPPTPPPLELPEYRRTSGLAVLSLALALVGAFLPPVSIAAIAIGVYALKQITDNSKKMDGVTYARAGIAVGAVFTLVTLAAFISPTVFGIDSFLRELAFAGRVEYPIGEFMESSGKDDTIMLKRPHPANKWARYNSPNNPSNNVVPDDLIMVNIVEDAYIAYQNVSLELDEIGHEAHLKKALERFHKSELVNLLGRLKGDPLTIEGTIVDKKLDAGNNAQEVVLDLRLGGVERRFFLYLEPKNITSLTMLVGATRRNRFDRMQNDFRETFLAKKFK